MDKLLITINDIKEYRPMAELNQARVDTYIREAQLNDLREFLGDALYRDLIANTSDTKYQNLLNGVDYTYANGNTIHYNGLIPVLVYHSLARIILNNQVNITSYGVVRKVVGESEPTDASTIKMLVTELRSIAASYQENAEDYLDANLATYPLWRYNTATDSMTTGLKFFSL